MESALQGVAPLARSSVSAAARSVALLILAGALASPAQAQPPPVSPQDFVAAAAGASEYEIMAAHVALIESRDAGVRSYAQRMIGEHAAAIDKLRDAALRSGLKPPSESVGGDQVQLLAALQGLRPPEFDRVYARQQVLAHSAALTTERGYARDGSVAGLRAVARADLPMIERHLQAAETLMASKGE